MCDVIGVKERIFVRSFVKPKNIRLLGFDIRSPLGHVWSSLNSHVGYPTFRSTSTVRIGYSVVV